MEKKGILKKRSEKDEHRSKQQADGTPKMGVAAREGKKKALISSESESTIYQQAVKRGSSSSEDMELNNTGEEIDVGMANNEGSSLGLIQSNDDNDTNSKIFLNIDRHRARTNCDCSGGGHNQSYDDKTRYNQAPRSREDWRDARPRCSYQMNPQQAAAKEYEDEIDARLDRVIRDAESSRAYVQEVPGKGSIDTNDNEQLHDQFLHSILIDEDYSILGGHLDVRLRRKIMDNVDFARLLPRDRVKLEGDHRMEMVVQNGQTYWIPFADHDNLAITSYHKWELAFREFSNVYSSTH